MNDANETYLIFDRMYSNHSVIYFVQAASVNDAIPEWLRAEWLDHIQFESDGSVHNKGRHYPHVLAYIEANYKIYGEWQIRYMPAWVWQKQVVEAFCGESSDGPGEVIAYCRKRFNEAVPRSRAKAFVWYLNQGTLVTFYRKTKPFGTIKVLMRYLWNWDGKEMTIQDWDNDDYQRIADNLFTYLERRNQ